MRLNIRHRTVYRYDRPIAYAIQTLRLTPSPHDGLHILSWRLRGETRRPLTASTDGFGNVVHCHTVNHPHDSSAVFVEGEVETQDTAGVVRNAPDPLPPLYFLQPTPLTGVTPRIDAFAQEAVGGISAPLDRLHQLMGAVRDAVDWQLGRTAVHTDADEALAEGAGVCQDHAHLFIAACRALGTPARYVSGYLWTGNHNEEFEANHAWSEAFVPGLGWVGFDPANRVCPNEYYVRCAVGPDYRGAAPVRGLVRGEAVEEMEVQVRVTQAAGAQQ
ncbi:MAG: transglutaminase family protein [Rhodospirillaceae bacterium]|nr:transglutaminase family protein [Rhodospirillaceae bacterium]